MADDPKKELYRDGLTIRDHFAGRALQAMVAATIGTKAGREPSELAAAAYEIADAKKSFKIAGKTGGHVADNVKEWAAMHGFTVTGESTGPGGVDRLLFPEEGINADSIPSP